MKSAYKYPHKPTILIVDDNAENLEVLGKILDIYGYNIEFADDPLLVYDLVKSNKPDMILMDVMMPNMNGYQLTDLIKSDDDLADLPIIFVTANKEKEGLIEGFNVGGADYVIKPFDAKELVMRIDTHLQLKFARETIVQTVKELSDANEQLVKSNAIKDKYLNIINQELQNAADYVTSSLPLAIPNGSVQANWYYIPTSSLGGDSFGYKFLDNDHFAFYLLDVCGHGISSALHSLSILNSINYQNLPNVDYRHPEEVLAQLNSRYQMNERTNQLFSIFYGVYNLSSKTLRYAGAGHPPAILFDNGSEPIYLESQNRIIGFIPDLVFKSETIQVNDLSDLYLFTDGAYEFLQANGNRGEIDDLKKIIVKCRKSSNPNELKKIYSEVVVKNNNLPLSDDFSILKFHLNGVS